MTQVPQRFVAELVAIVGGLGVVLEVAHRQGAETDEPEGARYIEISDTLAREQVELIRATLGVPAGESIASYLKIAAPDSPGARQAES